MAYLPLILISIAALASGGAVIAVIIAIRANRERRTTIFPVIKEVAEIHTKRSIIATIALLLIGALAMGSWMALQETGEPFQLAVSTPPQPIVASPVTTSPAPTATPAANNNIKIVGSTTILTPQPGSSATPTASPLPTATPAPTNTPVPPATETPVPAAVQTAAANSQLGPIEFGLDITDDREPVNPATQFTPQANQIYATFPYRNMQNGTPFAAVWYYQNVEIMRDEYEWNWGLTDRSFVFIKPVGPGNYRLELQIGATTVTSATFTVAR